MNSAASARGPRFRIALPSSGSVGLPEAQIAALSWILARKQGGTVVVLATLPDGSTSNEESLQAALADLRWLGIDWDEGPDVGGPFAPYRQDRRGELYREQLQRILREGKAYRCYCTAEELRAERDQQVRQGLPPRYSGKCRDLPPDEEERRRLEGKPHRLRIRVPEDARESQLDDFVIAEDGEEPNALFRMAVDDGLLEIDVVIQPEDRRVESLRCAVLGSLLGLPVPKYLHVPALELAAKSARAQHPVIGSVSGLRKLGLLPEAVLAYLAQLTGIQLEPVRGAEPIIPSQWPAPEAEAGRAQRFRVEDLYRLNRIAMEKMPAEAFRCAAEDYLMQSGVSVPATALPRWLDLMKERLTLLSELLPEAAVLVEGPDLTNRGLFELLRREAGQKVLWSFLRRIQSLEILTADAFREVMREVSQETGLLGNALWDPIRVALVGRAKEPKIAEIAGILGKEECERRIQRALEVSR